MHSQRLNDSSGLYFTSDALSLRDDEEKMPASDTILLNIISEENSYESNIDAMASSLQSCFALYKCVKPSLSGNVRVSGRVRAQSSEDRGRSTDIVDSNMKVLRKRIEQLRMLEKLRRSYSGHEAGWYYPSGYDFNLKRKRRALESMEIAVIMVRTFGLTLFSGTLGLCLVSLLVHLNH